MKEPRRVLHVFNWFNQGGVENFVMNVYRNIDKNRIQFDFALTSGRKGYFDEEAEKLGAHIYHYDNDSNTLINHYKNLTRIIKEHGPYAAVHSHVYFFSGYILWIARKCGVPIRIAHSHDTQKGKKVTLIRMAYEHLMRYMIKANTTNCLCCSDAAGRYVFTEAMNYQVLYNGIDAQRFTFDTSMRQVYREKLGVENKKVILNVGRFADQKNHIFIVNIFKELSKLRDDTVLVLIGTGPLKHDIEHYLKQLGLYEKVYFRSNIMDTENYYRAADIFILPSKYEGMSIVSIESQATGLYSLLSTKITREVGITDIIEYLDIDEPQKWANKINDILTRDYDRSRYNKLIAGTQFDIKRTVSDLEKIYLRQISEISI